MPRELNRRTEGRVGLHENFARRFAAAGATGDLGEELKGALARRGNPADAARDRR